MSIGLYVQRATLHGVVRCIVESKCIKNACLVQALKSQRFWPCWRAAERAYALAEGALIARAVTVRSKPTILHNVNYQPN
ncbi:hypothetical protein JOE11_005382 [Robbsia andropogonis]